MEDDGCGLPALVEGGRLPEGRHRGTIKDLRMRFVDGAPHSEHRNRILHAFELYSWQTWTLLPTARLWVNGGFVTHKSAKPKDIDVVIVARPSEVNVLDMSEMIPLLTHTGEDGVRVQPMGGLVDGFIVERGNPDKIRYWDDYWKTVLDESRVALEGERKGYVEVSAP